MTQSVATTWVRPSQFTARDGGYVCPGCFAFVPMGRTHPWGCDRPAVLGTRRFPPPGYFADVELTA